MRRRFALWLIAASLPGSVSAMAETSIGVLLPLTGPHAQEGQAALRGMRLAVREANAAMVRGDRNFIVLITADDAGGAATAAQLVHHLARPGAPAAEQPRLLVGLTAPDAALAASVAANEAHIPLLTLVGSPAISGAGKWSSTLEDDADLEIDTVLAEVKSRIKPASVASIIGRGNERGIGQNIYVRYELSYVSRLLPGEEIGATDSEAASLATRMRAANPDLIFLTTGSPEGDARLIQTLRRTGVTSRILATADALSPDFTRLAGDAAEGVMAPADFLPAGTNERAQDFARQYQELYGATATRWAAIGHTAITIAREATHRAGPDAPHAAVRDALDSIRRLPIVLGGGSFSFDANRTASYDFVPAIRRGGAWVRLSN